MRRTLTAFVTAALFAAPALAQDQVQATFPGFDPGTTTRGWLKTAGPNWQIEWSHERGTPELIYGGNRAVLPASAVGSDASLEQAARGVVDGLATALGFTSETLQLVRVHRLDHLADAGTTPKIVVNFRQVTGGVPTWNGTVNVLFSYDGRLLALDNSALPHAAQIPMAPENSEAAALQLAKQSFASETGLDAAAWTRNDYVLYPAPIAAGKDAVRGVPAYTFTLDAQINPLSGALPVIREYAIAATGALRVLDSHTLVHQLDLTGTVNGWGQVGLGPDGEENETQHALKDVKLSGTGIPANTFTDNSGNFTVTNVASPVSVTAALQGQFSRVVNTAGASSTVVQTVTPGVPATFTFNPGKTEQGTAEVNAHFFTEAQRDFLKSVDPAETILDFQRLENVNEAATCNAFYDGGSTNFYLSGGGCPNSAYSTVVWHENGHWLNDLYGSGNGGDGFGEGGADCWAMYEADNPVVALDFFGPGTNIRTGTNGTQFCGDANPGCYGEVHTDGEVLMGAIWKVRANLEAALGTGPGGNVANHLLVSWYQVYNDAQIKSIIETHWLTLDDDNGNINDGTPHLAQINAGFTTQGFPGFIPPLFTITHTPLTVVNSEAQVPVEANVTPIGSNVLSTVTLNWSNDGSTWHPVAMAPQGGNNWLGFIPGQVSPKVMRYWLEAAGPNGSNKLPVGGQNSPFLFDIGTLTTQVAYDFEPVSDEGWTHAQIATQDDWQHGTPQGKSTDPAFAFSGTRCWGNDLGLTVGGQTFNGEYQPNVNNYLQSPILNMTGKTNLRLRFERWLGVEDALYDQAKVVINGNTIFTNVATGGGTNQTIDSAWTPQDFDIGAFANNNASVQLKFSLQSDGGLQFGGWTIDDVKIVSLSPVQPTAFIEYGSGTVGFGGQAPHLTGSGNGTPGGTVNFNIANGRPSALGALFIGSAQASIPFKGGTFLVAPPFAQVALNLGPAGTASTGGQVPPDPGLFGITVYMQYWCNDVSAVKGKAGSNGLKFLIN
jgi:Immune inhibitor A-like, MAM domain